MISIPIQFGEWLPDQVGYQNPGVVVAENVYPSSGGYTKFESPSKTGDTTTEVAAGAALFVKTDNTPLIVGGSSTRLFSRVPGTVTETAGYTALGSNHVWRFERYNNMIIAVTPNNVPQYLTDLDTDTSWSTLGGSPPKAAVIGRVSDFIVMGDLTDIDASTQPYRVRWSALNNPTGNWVTDRGELSDFRTLDPKYGRITGVVGGRFGIVFQERAIWRMTFIGSPKVFDFELVSTDRGCAAPDSVVTIGFNTYFLSQDGFYVTNGSGVDPISSQRVAEWFAAEVKQSEYDRPQGALNWPKQSIVWAFIPSDGTGFTRQVIYSFGEDKWSYATEAVDYLVKTKTDAVNIGGLATLYPGGIGDIGVISNSDWLSKNYALAAFVEPTDTGPYVIEDYVLSGYVEEQPGGSEFALLSGGAREAIIEVGDYQIAAGFNTHVTGILPIVENASGNTRTQVLTRTKQGAAQSAMASTSEGEDGFCPHKVDARFISARMIIPANATWDNASAIYIQARKAGAK
jgi:hypothetical protein